MKINTADRVEVIDVLRGCALLGILIVHYCGEFAGWSSVYKSPVETASLATAQIDSAVNFSLYLLLIGKSRALFAFLFGVGFYYQLDKATRNGNRIEESFAKRMLILFLIGILHAYLLWSGDILRIYAISGTALLLVYQWKPRSLFLMAVLCSVIVPAVGVIIRSFVPYVNVSEPDMIQIYNGFAGDQYADWMGANLLRDIAINWDPYSTSTYFIPVFGNFLFGYWAAKTKLFDKLSNDKTFLHRCLLLSFFFGFIGSSSFTRMIEKTFGVTMNNLSVFWRDVLAFPASFSIEAMAFFLLCLVVYLYKIPFFRSKLAVFTFAGRMTLTNYVMQSAFGILFFFGIGMGFISQFGSFISLFISLAFFAFQTWYSRLWLQYFTIGPIEFLWRSIIENKWLTIRRAETNELLVINNA